jgi:AcrR family transcriptional regulator
MSSPPTAPRRTGRRPGTSETREAIARAARAQFAEAGYDRATVRKIAAAAGVDPALVMHFFGSKEALFREVMSMPPAIAEGLAQLVAGDRATVGRRLAELVVGGLENPELRGIVLGRIRSAASHEEAAALVRETVAIDMRRIADGLGSDQPQLRANLVGVQIVGVAFARYVVKVEPLASLDAATLVDLLAADFQRHLTEPLPGSADPSAPGDR